MTDRILDAVRRRVAGADAVRHTDQTLTMQLDDRGVASLSETEHVRRQIRLLAEGRMGWAGGDHRPDAELVDEAWMSLRTGEVCDILLPAPAPLPAVPTSSAEVECSGPAELEIRARSLRDRLRRKGRRVTVWIERSFGSTRVANTRGVVAEFPSTLAGLGASVEGGGTSSAGHPVCDQIQGVEFPSLHALEALVSDLEARLALPELADSPLPSRLPVLLAPGAVAQLLRPLRAAMTAPETLDPAQADLREGGLASGITLTDDPWVPLRPGSRPVDDEGVVTAPTVLVSGGRLVGRIADLATGARCGIPSTGHGRRGGSDPVRPGWSNVRMDAGTETGEELRLRVGNGLFVRDLEMLPGNVTGGGFLARVRWGARMADGELVGSVSGVEIGGNVFDLLRRIIGIGDSPLWVGAQELPFLALEGVRVRLWNR
jgi:predicted Zn-dependent protease